MSFANYGKNVVKLETELMVAIGVSHQIILHSPWEVSNEASMAYIYTWIGIPKCPCETWEAHLGGYMAHLLLTFIGGYGIGRMLFDFCVSSSFIIITLWFLLVHVIFFVLVMVLFVVSSILFSIICIVTSSQLYSFSYLLWWSVLFELRVFTSTRYGLGQHLHDRRLPSVVDEDSS